MKAGEEVQCQLSSSVVAATTWTGGLLGRLDVELLLDYDAKDEIGAVLPYRLVPSILIGGVNDVRQLAGAPLVDYDAVEGTGAVLPCRQYIEAAGREMDEESGRGFQ